MNTDSRILVVDDQYPVRVLIQRALTKAGYTVDIAGSGQQALQKLAAQPYALIITDLVMPNMSGLDMLAAVKENSPDTEVILVTAHGTLESAITALRHGAHDYLSKPFEINELLNSVQRTLEYRRLKQERTALTSHLEAQSAELRHMLTASNQLAHISVGDALPLDEIVSIIAQTLGLETAITVFAEPNTPPQHAFSAAANANWHTTISRSITRPADLDAILDCAASPHTKVKLLTAACFSLPQPAISANEHLAAIPLDVSPQLAKAVLWICPPHTLSDDAIQRLELLANHISAALVNARLVLTQRLQLDVLQTILEATQQLMPHAEQVGIFYRREPTADFSFVGINRRGETIAAPPFPAAEIEPFLHISRLEHTPEWHTDSGTHARIIAPLIASGIALGALVIISDHPHAFPAEHRQVLPMLTNQAAIAMQNAKLYEESRQLDELGALVEAGQAINRTLNLKETLQTTLTVTRNLTNALVSFIYLFTPDQTHIDSVITLEREGSLPPTDRRKSGELAWAVFSENQPQLRHTPFPDDADTAADHTVQSWLAVPLGTGSAPMGALVLGSERRSAFTPDDPRLIQVIAAQAATAIENARLYEEVERRLQQTQALDAITRSISTSLNLPHVLELIVQSAAKTMPAATNSIVYLLEGESSALKMEAQATAHTDLPAEVFRTRETVVQQAIVSQSPARHSTRISATGSETVWSFLAAPLQVRDAVFGAIVVESPHPGGFLPGDETLLSTFASHASVAIQNANLFQELTSAYIDLSHHQDELLRHNQTLHALFDGITDGLTIVNRNLEIVAINQAEADRLGKSPDELVGRTGDEQIWGEAAPVIRRIVRDTITRKKGILWASGTHTYKKLTVAHRGVFSERDVRTYPIFSADESVNQVIIFAQDVSEKHQLQATLFRSANLAAVGQLASSIAHEINNPLTVIIANTQILQMDADPDNPDAALIDYVLEAGLRIQHIVQNLLDFSTQESYEWEEVDVETTIDDALTLIAAPLRKGKIEVLKRLPALPSIVASANHLQLIWMNLLQNARESIAQTGHTGIIEISAGQPTPETVQITIADNGIGIPKENLERLFRPFFTTKPPGQGPGLGLYTCRTIVQHHHGSIDVQNNPTGHGAIATVTLPVNQD